MARLEGTINVPRCCRDVALSHLGLVCLLWLVTWRPRVVCVMICVVDVCRSGGGQSTPVVCERQQERALDVTWRYHTIIVVVSVCHCGGGRSVMVVFRDGDGEWWPFEGGDAAAMGCGRQWWW
jgi:hypothetical protein